MAKKEIPQKKIDTYFNYFTANTPTQTSRFIQGFCAFCIYFAIIGLSWNIPFPHFGFLGQYNSYFNWASFIIAFTIYYYTKLSPFMSYLMLFLTLLFTYIISLLQTQHSGDNLFLAQIYFLILFACGMIRYITYKMNGKNSTLKMEFLFIMLGPGWIFHFFLNKFSVKY